MALYDEPFADSSAIPAYRVCELAEEHVTVALSGDGGDEHFVGYRRHRWHMNEEKLRSKLPLGPRKHVFAALGRLYPKSDWTPRVFRAKMMFQALTRDSVSAYIHTMSHRSEEQCSILFSDSLKSELQGYRAAETLRYHAERAQTVVPRPPIQYLDTKTYLVGDILTKVDRASMAHALEVRVPLAEWFRGPLRERMRRTLTEGGLVESGLFNIRYLETLVGQHLCRRSRP